MCYLPARSSNKLLKINTWRKPLKVWNIWQIMKLTWYPYGNAKIGSSSFAIHAHAQDIGNVLPKLSQEPIEASKHSLPGQTIKRAKANCLELLNILGLSSILKCSKSSVVVQSLSCVRLFGIPWTAAYQSSLSFAISQSLLKLMSIELVMSSRHFILCYTLLLWPSIFPRIRVLSNEKHQGLIQIK